MKQILNFIICAFSFLFCILTLCLALEVKEQKKQIEQLESSYTFLTKKYQELEKQTERNARIIQQDLLIMRTGWED